MLQSRTNSAASTISAYSTLSSDGPPKDTSRFSVDSITPYVPLTRFHSLLSHLGSISLISRPRAAKRKPSFKFKGPEPLLPIALSTPAATQLPTISEKPPASIEEKKQIEERKKIEEKKNLNPNANDNDSASDSEPDNLKAGPKDSAIRSRAERLQEILRTQVI